jgi:hypothetical protein
VAEGMYAESREAPVSLVSAQDASRMSGSPRVRDMDMRPLDTPRSSSFEDSSAAAT